MSTTPGWNVHLTYALEDPLIRAEGLLDIVAELSGYAAAGRISPELREVSLQLTIDREYALLAATDAIVLVETAFDRFHVKGAELTSCHIWIEAEAGRAA